MAKVWNSNIPCEHISKASKNIVNYMNRRRFGEMKSLQTRWRKFNDTCMGGIEPGVIYTIGGRTGCGKSAFLTSLTSDLFDRNVGIDVVVLAFTFEMSASRNVGRLISYKTKKTTSELYSGKIEYKLDDAGAQQAEEVSQDVSKYNIYYIEKRLTVEEIKSCVEYFREVIAKDKWLIVTLDHTLLVKTGSGQTEKNMLDDLQAMWIEQKKLGTTTIIQLQQLNRNIEDPERIQNPSMHYPQARDVSTSDGVWQASDYVIILSRPELLNLAYYGTSRLPVKGYIYMHILKNRDGEVRILQFLNNLHNSSIEEPDKIVLTNPT